MLAGAWAQLQPLPTQTDAANLLCTSLAAAACFNAFLVYLGVMLGWQKLKKEGQKCVHHATPHRVRPSSD